MMQALYRGWVGRRIARHKRITWTAAAIVIQCAWRCRLARKAMQLQREAVRRGWRKRVRWGLLVLQRWFRMMRARWMYLDVQTATLDIQCWWRQYLARQVMRLRLFEDEYVHERLQRGAWGQVGMVVVPTSYLRRYLQPGGARRRLQEQRLARRKALAQSRRQQRQQQRRRRKEADSRQKRTPHRKRMQGLSASTSELLPKKSKKRGDARFVPGLPPEVLTPHQAKAYASATMRARKGRRPGSAGPAMSRRQRRNQPPASPIRTTQRRRSSRRSSSAVVENPEAAMASQQPASRRILTQPAASPKQRSRRRPRSSSGRMTRGNVSTAASAASPILNFLATHEQAVQAELKALPFAAASSSAGGGVGGGTNFHNLGDLELDRPWATETGLARPWGPEDSSDDEDEEALLRATLRTSSIATADGEAAGPETHGQAAAGHPHNPELAQTWSKKAPLLALGDANPMRAETRRKQQHKQRRRHKYRAMRTARLRRAGMVPTPYEPAGIPDTAIGDPVAATVDLTGAFETMSAAGLEEEVGEEEEEAKQGTAKSATAALLDDHSGDAVTLFESQGGSLQNAGSQRRRVRVQSPETARVGPAPKREWHRPYNFSRSYAWRKAQSGEGGTASDEEAATALADAAVARAQATTARKGTAGRKPRKKRPSTSQSAGSRAQDTQDAEQRQQQEQEAVAAPAQDDDSDEYPSALVTPRPSAEELARLERLRTAKKPQCRLAEGPLGHAAALAMQKLSMEVLHWNRIDPGHWRVMTFRVSESECGAAAAPSCVCAAA